MSRFHNRNFELLEPYEGKLSRTVLRGEGGSNALDLPDDYMGGKDLLDPVTATTPPAFPAKVEKIRVPYPPESELSGIARGGDTCLWYKRSFSVPQAWKGRHVLLNFGAVDRISSVFVNGKKVGTHTGGYDAFSLYY